MTELRLHIRRLIIDRDPAGARSAPVLAEEIGAAIRARLTGGASASTRGGWMAQSVAESVLACPRVKNPSGQVGPASGEHRSEPW